MQTITRSEALDALERDRIDEAFRYIIEGEPDKLGKLSVFFVTVWYGEDVDFIDIAFIRENGKVRVYNGG